MTTDFVRFPEGFLWGAATSSFQVEGSPLADGAAPSDWHQWTKTPGKIAGGDDADTACDHYRRYREDVALMKDLGLGTYRFSLSWPRLVPERGSFNEKALDFYRRLLEELGKAGILPNITLYHWELPLWAKGGWENRETALAFREYAEAVFRKLGGASPYWSTLNEPVVVAEVGHLMGFFPPGKKDPRAYGRVVHHLNLAHGLAVRAFRDLNLPGEIGWVQALGQVRPATDRPEDVEHARKIQAIHHGVYLDASAGRGYPPFFFEFAGRPEGPLEEDLKVIAQPVDFLGVNHYFPDYVRYAPGHGLLNNDSTPPPGIPFSDLGWPVVPEAFYDLLVYLWKTYGFRKMMVTENGTATRDTLRPPEEILEDDVRVHYLGHYLAQARRAIADGVPLKGYYAWSLLDNFEWTQGYDPRFGLVHVDFKTQKRTLKKSARWYKDVIAANGFDLEAVPKNPVYRFRRYVDPFEKK